jgi:hypothetical protein
MAPSVCWAGPTHALARELRNSTFERVLGMSDIELGLPSLLSNRPPCQG